MTPNFILLSTCHKYTRYLFHGVRRKLLSLWETYIKNIWSDVLVTELLIPAIVYFVSTLARWPTFHFGVGSFDEPQHWFILTFTMTRTTRQGRVATPAVVASTIGVSDKQQRVQKKAEKARKKHEKEQSKKARDGTNNRVSRARAIEIDALYHRNPGQPN